MPTMILVGDVNLMNVDDPAVPFARVGAELRAADLVFANLECLLYQPPDGHAVEHEGFFADPNIAGEALRIAGIAAVGIANNVNYGNAAILGSIDRLDRLGIAVIRGHTAYQVPAHKTRPEIPPMNRPGMPPVVVTWADRAYLAAFAEDIAVLRRDADVVVASCHWGLGEEVLDYMTEIAHAAIDAGADIVIGHGPHYSLPVELYKSKPIFYGLGSFSFHTGHGGRRHGDRIGMMAKIEAGPGSIADARFRFVRHNAANETVPCPLEDEGSIFDRLAAKSAALGANLTADGDWVHTGFGS